MHLRTKIVLLFCIFTGLLFSQIHAATAKELIDEALGLFQNGKNNEALAVLEKVLQQEPDNGTAIFLRGMAYARLKRLDEAIRDLQKGKELAGEFSVYHLEVGRIYFFKREYPKAIEFLKKYEEASPGNQEAARLLGYSYFFTNQLENAITYLKLALERGKEQQDSINYCLAICHLRLNQYKTMRTYIDATMATGSTSWFQKSAWSLAQTTRDYKVDEKRNPWWIQAQLAGGYDSNPLAFGEEFPNNLDQRYDWFLYYLLRGEYHIAFSLETTAYVKGFVFGRKYMEYDDSDQVAYGMELGVEHDFSEMFSVAGGLRHEHYYLDYHRYAYDLAGFVRATVKETDWISTQVEYSLKNRWYFYDAPASNDLDGLYHTIGVTQGFFIKVINWNIGLNYQHLIARPEGRNYKRDEDRFAIEVYGPLVWKNYLGLRFEYGTKNFHRNNTYYEDGNRERFDHTYLVHALFSREIAKPVTGFFSYTYERNDSNIRDFDYRRFVFMLGVIVNY